MGGSPIERATLEQFVAEYVRNGFNFAEAAHAVGRSPKSLRSREKTDDWFRAALEDAKQDMIAAVRAELYGRAVTGTERETVFQGVRVTLREKSDALLAKLAQAILPECKDNQLNVNVSGSIDLSDSQIAAKLAAVIAAARQRRLTGDVIDAEVIEVKQIPKLAEDLL